MTYQQFKSNITKWAKKLGEGESIPESKIKQWFDDPCRDLNERELVTLYFQGEDV